MEIEKKITLVELTNESVAIETERFVTIDDVETKLGDAERNFYYNDEANRKKLKTVLSTEQYTAVMLMFGYADNTELCSLAEEQLRQISEVYAND